MPLTRSTTLALLFGAALTAGSASAQYDVTRSGGPACWRVLTPSGAILSRHNQETEAFSAALTAGVAAGQEHIYVNACPHRVSGPGIEPLSGNTGVLLSGGVILTRGEQTGQVFESTVFEWSVDGGNTWVGSMELTFGAVQVIDALGVDSFKFRFRSP